MFSSKDLFFTPASTGYTVSKSLRFRSSASAYLNRTAGSSATNQNIGTWSFWLKRGTLGASQRIFEGYTASTDAGTSAIEFNSTDNIVFGGWTVNYRISTQVFRDPSAFYHFVVAIDTTQSTANNRVKIYVNGAEITAFSTTNNPAQSTTFGLNNNSSVLQIGRRRIVSNNDLFFDGYLAEVNFIDGAAKLPTDFGAFDTNGVWQPARYTGSYGTNGYYLKFTDTTSTTTLVADSSGNGNNWTPNNISLTSGTTYDSMLDSPTNATGDIGNYPVLNPLSFNSANVVDGNLAYLGANLTSTRASFAMPTSGKWYWELTPVNASPNYVGFGLMGTGTTGATNFGNVAAGSWGIYPTTNMFLSINGSSVATGIATPALGVVFAAAYDADTGNFWIGYSSSGSGSPTWFNSTGGTTGNPATGANPMATISAQTLFPAVSGNNTTSDKSAINFGQRPFALTVPSGYSSLNSQNLSTPTITNGAQYMAAVTYTGSASTQSVTATSTNSGNNPNAVTFQPDLVWIKDRTNAQSHKLTDAVRGTTKAISTDSTAAEATDANGVTAFNNNGFSLGTGTRAYSDSNLDSYVAWQWKEGVSQGFDIVSYAGDNTSNRNISHNLGVAPDFVWVKSLSTGSFYIWHRNLSGNTSFLKCNSTDGTNGQTTTNTPWGTGNWSSTQFMVTNNATNNLNASSTNYIAYLWAAIAGYSAMGIYTANAAATDGPFVYCGFRPRWVIVKATTAISGNWVVIDTSRLTYNQNGTALYPNLTNTEITTAYIDFLSNGFKIRNNSTNMNNTSSDTYIWAAFAENPFKISRAM